MKNGKVINISYCNFLEPKLYLWIKKYICISISETDYDTDLDNYDTETEEDWDLQLKLDESSTGDHDLRSMKD